MGTKVAEFSKSGPKSSQKQFLLKSKCFSKEPKTLPNVWATFLRNLAANTFQKLRYLITLFKTPIGMAPPSFVVLEWAFLISRLFSKIDKPPPLLRRRQLRQKIQLSKSLDLQIGIVGFNCFVNIDTNISIYLFTNELG